MFAVHTAAYRRQSRLASTYTGVHASKTRPVSNGATDKRETGRPDSTLLQQHIPYLRALELLPVERGAGISDFLALGTMLISRCCRGERFDRWWVSGTNGRQAIRLLHTPRTDHRVPNHDLHISGHIYTFLIRTLWAFFCLPSATSIALLHFSPFFSSNKQCVPYHTGDNKIVHPSDGFPSWVPRQGEEHMYTPSDASKRNDVDDVFLLSRHIRCVCRLFFPLSSII